MPKIDVQSTIDIRALQEAGGSICIRQPVNITFSGLYEFRFVGMRSSIGFVVVVVDFYPELQVNGGRF